MHLIKPLRRNRPDAEEQLIEAVAQFTDDPYGFAMFAYPWGEKGTALENETGPDEWQTELLKEIGRQLREPDKRPIPHGPIQIAVRSGHSIGKTALIAWLIQWYMSCRPHPQIPVTANTAEQLSTKTWRELKKWHALLINGHWFEWTATRFARKGDIGRTWFAHAITWSTVRPDAFQGAHESYVMLVFDEASAIDDMIWETAEGATATKEQIWLVFGNPTRNTGRFYECFRKFRASWTRREIDARNAKKSDKTKIERWLKDYGEDSDFFRVRVRGLEPRSGMTQFISTDAVERAMQRTLPADAYSFAARVLGVDVARFGDNKTVICRRQGLRVFGPLKDYVGKDTMQVASLVNQEIDEFKPHAVFIDEGGVGAGVIDRLRQLGHANVFGVNFGSTATDERRYHNKRTEIWGRCREWIEAGGCLPFDSELRDDLTGPEYSFDAKERFVLESKDDMTDRGLASPDKGDALALTFSETVVTSEIDDIVIEPEEYNNVGYY